MTTKEHPKVGTVFILRGICNIANVPELVKFEVLKELPDYTQESFSITSSFGNMTKIGNRGAVNIWRTYAEKGYKRIQ